MNLLPFLRGERSGPPHGVLYWRFGQQMAIRQGVWKLVKSSGGGTALPARGQATTEGAQLFNLSQDIGEKYNLAAQNPGKVRELAAAWNVWDAELIAPLWYPATGGAAAKKKP